MDESFLQPGEYWKYPQWYIDYVKGTGDKRLPFSAKRILSFLQDGDWETKLGNSGAGVGSVEACVELGLIECRPAQRLPKGGFIAKYRITRRGQSALEAKLLP